ncbi:hypothetical protein F2P81_002822 [Scophthalmus maximus]|uniref:Uncharacterized protein n=1 Tax=Scophthalmus maximus TaxID=52904 RepID=A0A6A4TJR9_SCOMX|nr:hypothetical protein F2P81_002822 [Scophthalmus maximus]
MEQTGGAGASSPPVRAHRGDTVRRRDRTSPHHRDSSADRRGSLSGVRVSITHEARGIFRAVVSVLSSSFVLTSKDIPDTARRSSNSSAAAAAAAMRRMIKECEVQEVETKKFDTEASRRSGQDRTDMRGTKRGSETPNHN